MNAATGRGPGWWLLTAIRGSVGEATWRPLPPSMETSRYSGSAKLLGDVAGFYQDGLMLFSNCVHCLLGRALAFNDEAAELGLSDQ